MKTLVMVGSSVLVSALLLPSCGSDQKTDCEKAKAPAKTKQLGETCTSSTYGTCATIFDDCVEGSCQQTMNGRVCTRLCQVFSDCPSGLYCAGPDPSARLCTPGATCETVCDGSTCCAYSPDPADPSRCLQGDCTAS